MECNAQKSDGEDITWLPCCRPGESSLFQPVVRFYALPTRTKQVKTF